MDVKSRFSENILSIRLSPNSISYWLGDKVIPNDWKSNRLRMLSPSFAEENELVFSEELSLYQNVEQIAADIMESAKELPAKKIVYIDTPKSVLVPTELYQEGSAKDYAVLHNFSPTGDEQIDLSLPIADTMAVMVSHKDGLRALGERLGEFSVASLTQYNLMRLPADSRIWKRAKQVLKVYLAPTRIYLTLFNTDEESQLTYADSYPISSFNDVVYYLAMLNEQFDIKRDPIYVKGVKNGSVVEQLHKQYKRIQCG